MPSNENRVETVCGCVCDICRHTPRCCHGIYCGTKAELDSFGNKVLMNEGRFIGNVS